MFGTRYLTDGDDIFDHNAWDDVELNDEQMKDALEKLSRATVHSSGLDESNSILDKSTAESWECFYTDHGNGFFKDRRWIIREFNEIVMAAAANSRPLNILDVGCGAGNTSVVILENIDNCFIHGIDCSETALNAFRQRNGFDPDRCKLSQVDLCSDESMLSKKRKLIGDHEPKFDFAVMVFTLSAIGPKHIRNALAYIWSLLSENSGTLIIRDYGRFDMAQLRFKPEKCVYGDSVFVRGDGTLATFFDKDELVELLKRTAAQSRPDCVVDVYESKYSRRLLTNRKNKKVMYRSWVQIKARLCSSSQ